MTERLTCTNCGAPITRNGDETRVVCQHCQHVTECAPVAPPAPPAGAARARDDDDDGGRVPNIVIIQAPAPPPQVVTRVVQAPAQAPQVVTRVVQAPPVVLQGRPVVIVRRSASPARIFGPLLVVLFVVGVSFYIRARAAHVAESVHAAEQGAEKAAEKAEKAADKKHH